MFVVTVSEITITQCFIDPWYAEAVSSHICYPSTTKEADAYKGKWVRVPRNLNAQAGWMGLVRARSAPVTSPFQS